MQYDSLLRHVSRYITLTSDETDFFTSLLEFKKIKRKQYLLREGDVSRHANFVVSGCFRLYSIDAAGGEHVLLFAIEDWWINDLYSFLTQ